MRHHHNDNDLFLPQGEQDSGSYQHFVGQNDTISSFKLLLVEGDTAYVGARNRLHYLSLKDLTQIATIEWPPEEPATSNCKRKGKAECDNYIRVVARKSKDRIFVCGTNSYQPTCRHYELTESNEFKMQNSRKEDVSGIGLCPFESEHNSTAIYS
ncbi:Semaphorin-1A, partial [Bulinus truncatus]